MEPTTEEAARYLLRVFSERGVRAGEGLTINSFIVAFSEPAWRWSDFQRGLEYAMTKGWVESSSTFIKLTRTGYSKTEDKAMNLKEFCTDQVTIERKDGTKYEKVFAQVGDKNILLPDDRTPVAAGDIIVRHLPHGEQERFVVVKPGYQAPVFDFPGHYQVSYRPADEVPPQPPVVNNYFHGHNSRVNVASVDNSVNVVKNGIEDAAVLAAELEKLRVELVKNATTADHFAAIGAIADAETAAKNNDAMSVDVALSRLKKSATWVWDTAQKIAIPVASKIIAHRLNLPTSEDA